MAVKRTFKNLEAFSRAIEREEGKVAEEAAKDTQRYFAREIFRAVVETTPVLTGQARYNWFPSLNTPSIDVLHFFRLEESRWEPGELEPVFSSPPGAVHETGTPMTSDELEKINSVLREQRGMPLGQRIWICNNLDYVSGLDMGTSTKAPNGIVLVAMEQVLAKARGRRSDASLRAVGEGSYSVAVRL